MDDARRNQLQRLAGLTLPKGNYTLEECIAVSHMSVVYRAFDNSTQQTVAVKFLLDETHLERFKHEAQLGYLVNISNVANTIRAEIEGEWIAEGLSLKYLVMKWITGPSLAEIIRQNRKASRSTREILDYACDLLVKLGPALDRIHSKDIFHRDIKPSNIRLNNDTFEQDEPYLIDFGIAKWANASDPWVASAPHHDATNPGEYLGTPRYMAPEQWDGPVGLSESDQYALAVTIYELLSDGISPFDKFWYQATSQQQDSATNEQVRLHIWEKAHRDSTPTPIKEYRPNVPRTAWRVLARALSKDAKQRYKSVGDFSDVFIEAVEQAKALVKQRQLQPDFSDLERELGIDTPAPFIKPIPNPTPLPVITSALILRSPTSLTPPLQSDVLPIPQREEIPQAPVPRRRLLIGIGVLTALAIIVLAILTSQPATVESVAVLEMDDSGINAAENNTLVPTPSQTLTPGLAQIVSTLELASARASRFDCVSFVSSIQALDTALTDQSSESATMLMQNRNLFRRFEDFCNAQEGTIDVSVPTDLVNDYRSLRDVLLSML
jgi:serine/threonine protein kinase